MRGFAPLGRLIVLALIGTGLGTVTLATAETAQAAITDGPTAIGVSSDGTSWVGFADGSKLVRVAANGKKREPIALGESESVDGIYVTSDNSVLVDLETKVVVLNGRGKKIGGFDHRPATSCSSRYPASRYGGITFGAGKVWVANRCSATMSVYRRNGGLVATVKLPGRGHPRGIAYGAAQSGRPAMVYVAMPDAHRILAYRAHTIRSSSRPAQRASIRRPAGGRLPSPSGLAVDAHGQLTVTDTANNAVYLIDTNHGYSLYRTLGHPPRASRQQGRLDNPSAIAQHEKDNGSLSGNLFIADTSNGRIQRWDSGGYTHWATRATSSGGGGGGSCGGDDWGCGGGGNGDGDDDGGDDGGNGGDDGGGSTGSAPSYQIAPAISGTPSVASVLTCSTGLWSGSGTLTFARQWLRNGVAITGATDPTYTVAAADAGTALTCKLTVSNKGGSTSYTTTAVTVTGGGGAGTGPTNTALPSISGSAAVGATLTCDEGTWTGSTPIGYAFQWRRAGTAISGATSDTYVVVAADAGQALTCAVTASNTAGPATAVSAATTIGSTGGAGPTNAVPPSITGSTAVGGTLTCASGAWTGAPTFSYQWKRAGVEIAGATSAQYVVTSSDPGTSLTCTVTARTSGGSSTMTTDPVVISQPATISGSAAPGEVLTCTPPSGFGFGASYQWLRNGSPIALATWSSYTVLSADLDASATLTCAVTSGSTTATSAGKVVAGWSGHAPSTSGSVPPSVSGTAAVGQTLTCDPGSWSGLPPVTTTTKWQRDGQDVGTGTTYAIGAGEVGTRLVCVVIAVNGYGKAAAATAPMTVQPSAPAVVTAPVISGAARIGSALTCDKGTWSGTGLTYAYRWSRDNTPIADSSAATYVVLNQDATKSLTCTVTATNTAGSMSRTSAAVTADPLTGDTPIPTVAPSITGTAATGQTLTCGRGTWTSAQAPTYLTVWQRNGATVGTGSTYTLTAADASASVRCLVVASIPGVASGAARSDAVGGNSCGGSVGVVVNGGAATTTSAQVTLSIRPPAGAHTVQITNDGDFTGATAIPLADSCTYDWTVPSIPGLAMDTTVSVRFDTAPTVYSDSITVAVPNTLSLRW